MNHLNQGDGIDSADSLHCNDWVVEWSERQQSFHVTTLPRSMRANFHVFLNGRSGEVDYQPIYVCSSHAAAHDFIARIQKFRDDGADRAREGRDNV